MRTRTARARTRGLRWLRAKERTPQRAVHEWLSFDPPPPGALHLMVRHAGVKDTGKAQRFAEDQLIPRIVRKEPVALDFAGVRVVTQSWAHALLFEPLRLAWARKTRIHILNADPAVRSTLSLLENYALGG